MIKLKKILISVCVLAFIFILADIPTISKPVAAQAAVKISKKTLTLGIGKSTTLKISGTKKTVKWSTSDKSVATVSKKGKVTAIFSGTATITATVNKKKYSCKVKVVNPSLKDAPFDAQEIPLADVSLVLPTDWSISYFPSDNGSIIVQLSPSDTTLKSVIFMQIDAIDQDIYDYETLKPAAAALNSEEFLSTSWDNILGNSDYEFSGYSQSDMKTSFDTMLKTSYTITVDGTNLQQEIYNFCAGNYVIEVQTMNFDGIDLAPMLEYIINSIIINK